MIPIERKIQKMNERLAQLDPDSVEAVTLTTQRDLCLMQAEDGDYDNGPTGHDDVCHSDADPGL